MGKPAEDISGKRFGRLVVIKRLWTASGSIIWLCKCDCGKKKKVSGSNLRGSTQSCGCYKSEVQTTHGKSRHPLYLTWFNMVRRCGSGNYGKTYEDVDIYPRWKESVTTFISYVEDNLGTKPTPTHSIDRIDNSRGYFPGNIRWATKGEQSNNREYVNTYEYRGEVKTVRYFSDKYGVNFNTLRTRLRKGQTICQAIETPLSKSHVKASRSRKKRFGEDQRKKV